MSRLPFGELVDYLEHRTGRPRWEWASYYGWTGVEALTLAEVAAVCGVSRRTVNRWKAVDAVPLWRADWIADELHEHPALIWPAWPEVVRASTTSACNTRPPQRLQATADVPEAAVIEWADVAEAGGDLAAVRHRWGVGPSEWARALGAHRASLREWETGKHRPSRTAIERARRQVEELAAA
jgi:DNA-binding XRE family transcriptional regulator